MLTKANSRTYEIFTYPSLRPRLNAMERGLLKWAVIDRDDRVLDVGLGNGLLVDYLRRNMECEVCGVSDNMELVRQTRSLVCSADLVYANAGEIPWRDGAFHSVLFRSQILDRETFFQQMQEVKRVLKEGGQLVVALESLPRILRLLKRMLNDGITDGAEQITRHDALEILTQLGFEHFSFERVSLDCVVMICWKHCASVRFSERQE